MTLRKRCQISNNVRVGARSDGGELGKKLTSWNIAGGSIIREWGRGGGDGGGDLGWPKDNLCLNELG